MSASEPLLDPVGSAIIEALMRRADAQQGEARLLMQRRVDVLIARAAAAVASATPADAAPDETASRRTALAGLSELIDRLGRSPVASAPVPSVPQATAARPGDAPKTAAQARAVAPAPLKSVTAFKGTWSRLRAEQRLRQALDQVPAMAGPLNSSHVVNRALQAMHELSPEYLDAFMSHIDTLLWLEQSSGAGDLAPRAAAPAEGRRPAGARTSRRA